MWHWVRRWLKRLWAWVKRLWAWVRGWFRRTPPPPPPAKSKDEFSSLSDAQYEVRFFQLLNGVERGWTPKRVREHLGERWRDPGFLNWLQRFGKKLLSSSVPNHQLARRMVQLRGEGCGALGETAAEIGEQLLARDVRVEPVESESQESGTVAEEREESTEAISNEGLLKKLSKAGGGK
ncbi:hypothetical protein [Baaleninema simplex]|uniref:hypothetical protein n=1 Tax=Baaleninema simplex TaxID=2862350 RepID=UPI0003643FBB|nr:hypothetical protein [Baaleninema simplex]